MSEENKLENDLKNVEYLFSQFEEKYKNTNPKGYYELRSFVHTHVGIKALYLQNKIIIEQNQEIIKYLKEKLE
jgi:hypothetical protein